MEKIPAASAMEWSIDLEKGLRSKSPGKCIEAILEIGSRLEWWNRESRISVAEYKIFHLIPGEDKLFANAILLRLADAFRVGDKRIKTCIVKVFREELKSRRRRSGRKVEDGILSKKKLENYLEILRRVKVVFDEGDVEERALALYLFGCWADFAKDSADVRYVILSSVVSDDVLEVKAALFAAGRFCELANDFASVLMEMLTNRLTSCETSMALKLVGGRALANMCCSLSLANRAYETGLKLLLDSSEENFSAVMLVSLTKLASCWTLLIPQQIELLFSYLAKYRATQIEVTTLTCLQFLFARGVCPCPASRDMVQNFFDMLNQSKFPPAVLRQVLKVLHKMLSYNLPTLPSSEMFMVFSTFLKFIENVNQSSIMSERLVAARVLVNILCKFLGRPKLEHDETAFTLAYQAISFIMDRISELVNSIVTRHTFLVNGLKTTKKGLLDGDQANEELEREVTSLLRSIFYLVENHSDISGLVLDRVGIFLEHLVSTLCRDVSIEKDNFLNYELSECGEEYKTANILKLVFSVTRIIVTCLENPEVEHAETAKVLNSLKLLIDYVCKSTPIGSSTYTIYLLLLHFHSACKCIWRQINPIVYLDDNYTPFYAGSFLHDNTFIAEFGKKMFGGRDNWSSYKAGKRAALQGLWSNAAFIFERLTKMAVSNSSYVWLKTLNLFSHSESQIEYFGIINVKDSLSEAGEEITPKNNLYNYVEILVRAYDGVHLAEKMLKMSAPGLSFTFQRWFLALRAKFLEILVDLSTLLGAVSFLEDSSSCGPEKMTVLVPSMIPLERYRFLVDSLASVSSQLKKLADEFDLLATSFVGMDRKSTRILLCLSAGCSLLAFSTGLFLSIPYLHVSENSVTKCLDGSEGHHRGVLIQDLFERLSLVDSETSKHLWMLLKVYGKSKSCFLSKSGNQAAGLYYEASSIVKLFKYAVSEIVGLQNEARIFCSDETKSQISSHGLKLLLSIIWKWMQIPFRCPDYFFQVRDNVFSELFSMNENGENFDGMSVSLGSHLSLNLCLKLKNMPPSLHLQLSKLYCILSCTVPSPHGKNIEKSWLNSEEWDTDDILALNHKLMRYATGSSTPNAMQDRTNAGSRWTEEYVCFRLNERGQGFSTCLLDVSAFPPGNYKIKWHSCWIDDEGSYGSLLPMNAGPNFAIENSSNSRTMQTEVS
nr:uncharacterized protein LOC113742147 isoform X1 [Coffea arabica]XP_027125675.1 uncharacterized protein LOC113742147 isoform X1 [Coffea arabica]XP_027125676.1 uncharacterized protein LOC113742147 isoform X1 [Coffea arabica]XP_027125677.1 uncharacterized protein LOC113742147 isoform X1 [Coffea arabica]XP_027125678.1 uncharacterized protein LOC113742147 isoform X1 [Coffea arabica]XP_027125679.1 uncharacterized protein LOC113742147 isoform X1 [Coffea arabica]XP_027125680.1 uncharacterized prot